MADFKHFSKIALHFSDLEGIPVSREKEKTFGKLVDFFVDYEEVYPSVLALQLKAKGRYFYVDWQDVLIFSPQGITISSDAHLSRGRYFPRRLSNVKNLPDENNRFLFSQLKGEILEYPSIGKVILDRQIVDTNGKKVVRVNDIQFITAGNKLRVTHAEIGLRSLLRRLHWEGLVDRMLRSIAPKSKFLRSNTVINWKFVHAIPDRSVQRNVRLNLSNNDIKNIHPADLAEILEDLDEHGRSIAFSELDAETRALTLPELSKEVQKSLLENEDPHVAAKILENMGTDEAADILKELDSANYNSILAKMRDSQMREEIEELVVYEDERAGGLMSTEFLSVSPEDTKKSILKTIKKIHQDIESIYDLFVVGSRGELLGVCPLNILLGQEEEETKIAAIMEGQDIKSMAPTEHWREVAKYMSKYNLINVPILDEGGILLGIVYVDDILPWLLEEAGIK